MALSPNDNLMHEQALRTLASRVQGQVIFRGDPSYEAERRVWNAALDCYPAVIVRCLNVDDVIAGVNFARERQLELSVRSGGHSIPGYSTNDQGMVLDLSSMKTITVDPVGRTARLEPGLTWGQVAKTLQPYGLAITSGDTATVGVGGLLLGGGIGWMVRKYGLAIDHLRAVELVTADGQFLRVSAEEHPELFWGLRGGGGNFGVVTAFEVDLHPGGTVLGGAIFYEATEAESIIQNYARIAAEAPDDLMTEALLILAPPAPFIPADKQGKPVVLIIVCCTGDMSEATRVVAPLRQLATPIADLIAPIPFSEIFAFMEIGEVRTFQHHAHTLFFKTLSEEMLRTLVKESQAVMSPETMIELRILGGAMSRVERDATAFAHRDAQALAFFTHFDAPSADATPLKDRSLRIFRALSPYADGAYVNFLADEGQQGVREAYPPTTYARLAALKRQYDPTNLFHLNQNIIPDTEKSI